MFNAQIPIMKEYNSPIGQIKSILVTTVTINSDRLVKYYSGCQSEKKLLNLQYDKCFTKKLLYLSNLKLSEYLLHATKAELNILKTCSTRLICIVHNIAQNVA